MLLDWLRVVRFPSWPYPVRHKFNFLLPRYQRQRTERSSGAESRNKSTAGAAEGRGEAE